MQNSFTIEAKLAIDSFIIIIITLKSSLPPILETPSGVLIVGYLYKYWNSFCLQKIISKYGKFLLHLTRSCWDKENET